MKLKLVYLHLKQCINKIFMHFLNLLFVGLRNKDKIIISLLIAFALIQYNPKKNFQKVIDFLTFYNLEIFEPLVNAGNFKVLIVDENSDEVINSISINELKDYVIYGLLIIIILSLWVLIFKKNGINLEFPSIISSSDIDKLIMKGKIELALKKLYKKAKNKDEVLSNEIVLLRNRLSRNNKDRLSGLLPDEDYQVRRNRVIKRTIDIVDELELS